MKFSALIIAGGIGVCLLGGCTQRRTSDAPVPDGDTIEVVVPEIKRNASGPNIRIIEIEENDVSEQDTSFDPSLP